MYQDPSYWHEEPFVHWVEGQPLVERFLAFDAQTLGGTVFADPLRQSAPLDVAAWATRRLAGLLQEQVKRAARLLEAACSALYLVEGTSLALRALSGAAWSEESTRLGMLVTPGSPALLALLERTAVESGQADPPVLQEWAEARQVGRWLYVPVFGLAASWSLSSGARGGDSNGLAREYTDQASVPRVPLGVLAVGRTTRAAPFTVTETHLLSELGRSLALAIEQVRLAEQVEVGWEVGRRYQEMLNYVGERERILQELDEGVLLAAPFGRVLHVNAKGRELLGWPSGAGSAAVPGRVQDYVPVELRAAGGDVLLLEDWPVFRALRGERFTNVELHYRGPDGHERLLVFSGRPLLDVQGKLEYALVSFHQASSEQMARAELEQIARLADQRALYVGSVLEAMTDGVLVCNQQGMLLLVNPAGRRMLGIERAQILTGQYHIARFVTDIQARTLSGQPLAVEEFPLMRALRGETVHDMEVTLRQPDTGYEWQAHVSASPITARADNAAVVGAVAVLVDVTNARRLDRAKDEFLALSAHELKGPLTSIRGFAQLLRRGARLAPHGVERRADMQWVEKIEVQADRLGRLIEELTDAARADLGKFDLKLRLVPLGALLRHVAEAQQVTTERHRITVDAPAAGLFVRGDEARLEQVFNNLVANAIKYSPAGGEVAMVVARQDEAQPGPFVEVAVRDQGMGIAASDLERIFTRFTRADPPRSVQGLGLGLYIARGIIEAHGGTIRAESKGLGQGSTFVVRLPRAEQQRGGA